MQAVKGHVDYYWQTCAWSNHLVADFVHMYQQQGSPTIAGIQIDKNDIKMDPGAWGQQKVNAAHIAEPVHTESAPLKVIGRVKVIATDLRMRKGPGMGFPVVGEAVTGKIYNVYAVSDQWHQIGADQWVWGEGGKYLELITDGPQTNQSAVVPYPGHSLNRGSTGKDVERVQRAIGVNPDGVFGPKTEAAVRAYQQRHGLSVDGIVGPQSWNVMF
jgi:peptidoglycan hydrolase-like protein with peptidoglycan-binding domain